uniref:Cuticle protein 6 n=1 Tax=Glossina brevipalpis TaxID=37001 RepID=A0A1A9WCY2_9MUSC
MSQWITFILASFILSLQLGKAFMKTFLEQNVSRLKDGVVKSNYNHKLTGTPQYYYSNLNGPYTYAFGYEVNDKASGNIQFRDERKYANDTVEGSFGYVQPDKSLIVTHYFTNRSHGYSSRTEVIKPGSEFKSQSLNITTIYDKSFEKNNTSPTDQVNIKLNLTDILLPVEPIKKEYGINLNPATLEREIINHVVLDAIDESMSLEGVTKPKKSFNNLQIKPVHKFLPADFPIIPFQLPVNKKYRKDNSSIRSDSTESNELKEIISENSQIYEPHNLTNFTDNNFELNSSNLSKKVSNLSTMSVSEKANFNWYENIIKYNRKKYLDALEFKNKKSQ